MTLKDRVNKFRDEYDLTKIMVCAAGAGVVLVGASMLNNKRKLLKIHLKMDQLTLNDRLEYLKKIAEANRQDQIWWDAYENHPEIHKLAEEAANKVLEAAKK